MRAVAGEPLLVEQHLVDRADAVTPGSRRDLSESFGGATAEPGKPRARPWIELGIFEPGDDQRGAGQIERLFTEDGRSSADRRRATGPCSWRGDSRDVMAEQALDHVDRDSSSEAITASGPPRAPAA